jgi:hypothetical protein
VVSFTHLPLYLRERGWIGGWVGPRAGLDDAGKIKFLTQPGLEIRHIGRPSSRYTDYAIPAREKRQKEINLKNTMKNDKMGPQLIQQKFKLNPKAGSTKNKKKKENAKERALETDTPGKHETLN